MAEANTFCLHAQLGCRRLRESALSLRAKLENTSFLMMTGATHSHKQDPHYATFSPYSKIPELAKFIQFRLNPRTPKTSHQCLSCQGTCKTIQEGSGGEFILT